MTSFTKNSTIFIAVFFMVNLLLSSYFIDIWPTPNPVSRALPVLTLVQNGTYKIDKYENETMDKSKVGDHFYTDKAPLPTLLIIPFYEALKLFGLDKVSEDAGKKYPVYIYRPNGMYDSSQYMFTEIIPILLLGSFLIGSLPFTIIVLLSFISLRRVSFSISPVILSMMAFYGSLIFVFSGTYFNHVFAGLLLLISYIYLKEKRAFLSGIFLGLSFLSEYTVIVAAPLWLLLLYIKERKIKAPALFASGIVPSVVIILIYNWLITGNPLTMLNAYHESYKQLSHNYGFALPSLDALWGLSCSGSMGLFVFAPVLILFAYYLIKSIRKVPGFINKIRTNYVALFTILFFLVISSFFTWWGGWSYGPRYLIVLAVLVIYEGLLFISKIKVNIVAFMGVTFCGLISSWFAKSTLVFMVPDYFRYTRTMSNTFINILAPEFNEGRFNANNLCTAFFNLTPETGIYIWAVLFVLSITILTFWYSKSFPTIENQHSTSTITKNSFKKNKGLVR